MLSTIQYIEVDTNVCCPTLCESLKTVIKKVLFSLNIKVYSYVNTHCFSKLRYCINIFTQLEISMFLHSF